MNNHLHQNHPSLASIPPWTWGEAPSHLLPGVTAKPAPAPAINRILMANEEKKTTGRETSDSSVGCGAVQPSILAGTLSAWCLHRSRAEQWAAPAIPPITFAASHQPPGPPPNLRELQGGLGFPLGRWQYASK